MDNSASVIDVGESNFETEVIERSRTIPVVVDFWAPWCGPCRMLGPVLEHLVAGDFAGQMILAKVNTDENPELSAAFSIRGIPAVKIFSGGVVLTEFVGALPEAQLREIFASVVPNEADHLVADAEALETAGDTATAEQRVRAALKLDRRHAPAILLLSRLLAARGEVDEALTLLATITGPLEPVAATLTSKLTLEREARAAGEPKELERRLESDSSDVAARYGLALWRVVEGVYYTGLEQLLEVVQRDRKFKDDGARKAMLLVFNLLGNDHELVTEYRSKLSRALH